MKIVFGRGPWLVSLMYGIFTPIVLIIAIPFIVVSMAVIAVISPILGVLGLLKKVD